MNASVLYDKIRQRGSFLCIGLDTDLKKIPSSLRTRPSAVLDFNRAIVDVTHDLVIAYKPNLAFYEALGVDGWAILKDTVTYIRKNHPEIFLIADAKRGDIGNTASMYAQAFFDRMDFDAVTVSPYMGRDSVMPFLEYEDRCVIILGLTSNPGAEDFQLLETGESKLYEEVIRTGAGWGNPDNILFVTGATRAENLKRIRAIVPDHFLLVPGIGSQGGDLRAVAENGMNARCGLIVNASRSILYADSSATYAETARKEAAAIQNQMSGLLP